MMSVVFDCDTLPPPDDTPPVPFIPWRASAFDVAPDWPPDHGFASHWPRRRSGPPARPDRQTRREATRDYFPRPFRLWTAGLRIFPAVHRPKPRARWRPARRGYRPGPGLRIVLHRRRPVPRATREYSCCQSPWVYLPGRRPRWDRSSRAPANRPSSTSQRRIRTAVTARTCWASTRPRNQYRPERPERPTMRLPRRRRAAAPALPPEMSRR